MKTYLERAGWGKAESLDGSTSSASRGQDVLASWVDLGVRELVDVQVSGVLGIGGVAIVAGRDDWVEKLLEELVRLLVTSDNTASFDHGVT